MLVCSMCDEVQYHGAMPKGFGDFQFVVCYTCAEAANEYENMAFDIANDR